jgi:hypothetical protein
MRLMPRSLVLAASVGVYVAATLVAPPASGVAGRSLR